ncbi:MAG TPA: MFS transporter [Stellaceae bacterium]|nr:MFS transporter [Stellaceae bacterium]
MAAARTIDLAPIIDRQRIGAFHIGLIIVAFIVVMVDGYDIGAAAVAVPGMAREWHPSPVEIGQMFSAGLFAGLFGPLIFGWIADHYGRRAAIAGGLMFFGAFTWVTVLAGSMGQLAVLRFIAGIGISGVLPITTALVIEYAPRRVRATLFVIMFSGVTFGGGLPGIVGARLMADYGWRIMFTIGGIVPILIGFLVLVTLPESAKYLSLRPERSADLTRLLGRMEKGLNLDTAARFSIGDEDNRAKFSYTAIFKGRLAIITPLFWLSNAINLMIFYFVNQWIPTILSGNGVSVAHAQLATTAFQFAGTLGGLIIMRPLDKWGFIPVPILFALAIPIVAFTGTPGLSEGVTITLVAAIGFCLLGLQFGNIACETNMYPTYIRSWGVGSCFGAGRVGSVVGPYVGGYLIAMHLPMQHLFWIATIPLVIGLINALVLTPLYRAEWTAAHGTAGQPAHAAGED